MSSDACYSETQEKKLNGLVDLVDYTQHGSRNSANFLLTVLLLTAILYIVMFFDFPIARQVIGFLYFTFVIGYALLKLLGLEKMSFSEMIIFSVGFSLAILMIGGLLLNEIGSAIGISKPLSEMPLIIVFSGIALLFSFSSLYTNRESKVQVLDSLKLIARSPLAFPFLILPFLSVVGAIWVNAYGSNLILLLMIVVLASVFTMAVLFKRLLPHELYPLAVLAIAISLLFHSSLISGYVQNQRSDISFEYFVIKTTEENRRWSSVLVNYTDFTYGSFNSMLSITILPTIYSSLLNMDVTWILKILYPIFFSLVPLGLFYFWLPHVGKKAAFVSAFLFMALETFYTESLGLAKQMVAELFFVLLLFVILDKRMKLPIKWIFFVILSFALVVSHYGMSLIFFFFIFSVWVYLTVTKRTKQKITVSMLIFFFVVIFSWYIYTSNASTLDSFLWFGNHVYAKLDQFFNPASRGSGVLRGLGMEAAPSFLNVVSRAIAYFVQFLIVAGFVGILRRRVRAHFDQEFLILTQASMALLAMLILVPGLAETLNMTRFYHILLFFLAPLCFFGAETLVKFIFKRKTELKVLILLLTVLIPYFLFQTSFMYEVTGSESWLTIPLGKYRMGPLQLYGYYQYIDDVDVFGAQWFHKNIENEGAQIYADLNSKYVVLTSYGMTYRHNVEMLTNATQVVINGTVYLNRLNVVYGTISSARQSWNYSDLSFLENMNRIYSNGGSEIYKG